MQSSVTARSLPFIPEFEPDFAYDISIADYSINRPRNNHFIPRPLGIGESVPDFKLSRQTGVWQQLPAHLFSSQAISLTNLIDHKPLVISFYSPEWGDYSQTHLDMLDKAHQKISGLGGQLLVLTHLSVNAITQLINTHGLKFNLVTDTDNEIAERLGAYSAAYPLWQQVSGINEAVPAPATLVVAPTGVVVHSFHSPYLSEWFDIREVLTAVYTVKDMRQSA